MYPRLDVMPCLHLPCGESEGQQKEKKGKKKKENGKKKNRVLLKFGV